MFSRLKGKKSPILPHFAGGGNTEPNWKWFLANSKHAIEKNWPLKSLMFWTRVCWSNLIWSDWIHTMCERATMLTVIWANILGCHSARHFTNQQMDAWHHVLISDVGLISYKWTHSLCTMFPILKLFLRASATCFLYVSRYERLSVCY